MGFDFFNTSHLAFGSKLTQAFQELEKQASITEDSLRVVQEYLNLGNVYNNRNYRVAFPAELTSPVRTNELFDILDNCQSYIRELSYKDGTINVSVVLYDQLNNIVTNATGNTSNVLEGYCYVRKAGSNSKTDKDIQFLTKESKSAGILLFRYRVDAYGRLQIKDINDCMIITPGDDTEYTTLVQSGEFSESSHKATEFEGVLIVHEGMQANQTILNGQQVYAGYAPNNRVPGILYLKPGDVLSKGRISNCIKFHYEGI